MKTNQDEFGEFYFVYVYLNEVCKKRNLNLEGVHLYVAG